MIHLELVKRQLVTAPFEYPVELLCPGIFAINVPFVPVVFAPPCAFAPAACAVPPAVVPPPPAPPPAVQVLPLFTINVVLPPFPPALLPEVPAAPPTPTDPLTAARFVAPETRTRI